MRGEPEKPMAAASAVLRLVAAVTVNLRRLAG